jgi:hypothetical protein
MPVTAKLSKHFYDKFGEQVVGELVDWFNNVDATYRSDVRELNELNFARFEAKLEQRLAEFRADLVERIAQLDARMEKRFGESDAAGERRVITLTRWFVAIWLTTVFAAISVLVRR